MNTNRQDHLSLKNQLMLFKLRSPSWLLVMMVILMLVFSMTDGYAVQRFPKPEFESGYTQPQTLQPSSRADMLAVVDIVVLAVTLGFISWIVLKKRSRAMVFMTSLVSLIYFGFYRQGCICSIGALQNVALAMADQSYVIPLTAIVFFALPLIFTLFFGRTFCAGVCPFGAMQDLVAFHPQKLGIRLNTALGLIPYIYLGLAILYAATGTDFIICRYDPFVGFFRFDASFGMFIFAGILLLSGVFIARPYCRFLCPYSVILNWISRFSWKHMTITPAECIQCRLCEDSCPYDAIDVPSLVENSDSKPVKVRKMIMIILLVPFFTLLGGFTVSTMHEHLALLNGKVRLAHMLLETKDSVTTPETFEMTAFKTSGKPLAQVYADAKEILKKFYLGSWVLGAFLGLAFGLTLASRLKVRYHTDYVPNRGTCFSCARCTDYCPVKKHTEKIHP